MVDSQAEQQPQTDVLKAAVELIRQPERDKRLSREAEIELKKQYGLEPRIKKPIQGESIKYGDDTREGSIVDNSHWVARPATDEERENPDGFVYARPTQGRASSITIEPITDPITGETYRYADIKGNGWGGVPRSFIEFKIGSRPGFFFIDAGVEQERNPREYGLVDKSEVDQAVVLTQNRSGLHEKIIGLVTPTTLPDINGENRPANEVLQALGKSNFTPSFVVRLWHNPSAIADIFFTSNSDGELQFTQEKILNNPMLLNDQYIWYEHSSEDDDGIRRSLVLEFISSVKANAKPYIELMKQDYFADHGVVPTNDDLFKSFFQTHTDNYRELIKRGGVNGAIHTQNTRFGGEWGDNVTEGNVRTEAKKRQTRIKDFFDVYNCYVVMGLIYEQPVIMNPFEFYREALRDNQVDPSNYPKMIANFFYQDIYVESPEDSDPDKTLSNNRGSLDSRYLDLKRNNECLEELAWIMGVEIHHLSGDPYRFRQTHFSPKSKIQEVQKPEDNGLRFRD